MPRERPFPYDPNYVVDGIPPSIKGKITELINAAMDYAFIGAQDPEDHEAIEDDLNIARYNLERTIKGKLKK